MNNLLVGVVTYKLARRTSLLYAEAVLKIVSENGSTKNTRMATGQARYQIELYARKFNIVLPDAETDCHSQVSGCKASVSRKGQVM